MYNKETVETKNLSKSLVAGDCDSSGSSKRRWNVAAVLFAVLAVWLSVLTVARELQIRSLRRDVDELTASVITLTANVKSLNQKVSGNRLFNEFETLEDTIYADEDDQPKADGSESLQKLHKLTVFEDDDEGFETDDEDVYEDDPSESGDWHPDYASVKENKEKKRGKASSISLYSEEAPIVRIDGTEGDDKPASVIHQIKRLLNENPENPNIASKVSATPGTHTNSASKLRNKRSIDDGAAPAAVTGQDSKQLKDPLTETLLRVAANKTRNQTEEEHIISWMESNIQLGSIAKPCAKASSRNTRDVSDQPNTERPVAAHVHSAGGIEVNLGHRENFDSWSHKNINAHEKKSPKLISDSKYVKIRTTGLYFAYVQLYFVDDRDTISWVLWKIEKDSTNMNSLIHCVHTSISSVKGHKANSCFSASMIKLNRGDKLCVTTIEGDRRVTAHETKTFLGLMMLKEMQEQDD